MRIVVLSLLLLTVFTLHATEPMCGTSPENDFRVRALHERGGGGIRTLATSTALVRDGAFYVQTDDAITPGYRPFDLEGQTLVFTRLGGLEGPAFSLQRKELAYVEPTSQPVRDFKADTSSYFVSHELPFVFPFAGRNVTQIYVTAYNGISFDPPVNETATQFDAIEAAVHRGAILSPLMTTARKPRYVESPKVWIENANNDTVTVTWRSSGNAPFGYDVQAQLRKDGSITYSYRSVTAMRWGTPSILDGFDPGTTTRAPLVSVDDSTSDVLSTTPQSLRQMLNIKKVEVQRLRNSDLFAVRIQLSEAIDQTKIAIGDTIGFQATIGVETAAVEITRDRVMAVSFSGATYEPYGASAHVDGDVVEIYGIQHEPERAVERSLRVITLHRPSNRITDTHTLGVPFSVAPQTLSMDLSQYPGTSRQLPIVETFTLGVFDPFAVWNVLKSSHALSDYDYDAVAMFQSYFTDIIFYAGAYATSGNPQVDGVAPYSPGYGRHAGRAPTLLHMNQLTYNYSAAADTASKVMLHEFGHRWLYFFSIRENGTTARILNPISAHPAAYVHTASAYPVYGEKESSVMGGAYFTPQPDGTYKAHVANYGFSWTDLYLMGLAAPEEVPDWFYIANTDLPKAYWPAQGAIANGEKRNVNLSQVTAVHGPRTPSTAIAQKRFRVLFVLATENAEPTEAEVAKLNEWRAVMARNFDLATGGRGRLETTFVRAGKQRTSR